MPFRTLGETTMHPRNRTLLQVQIEETIDAHNAFRDLLGKDAEPRYRFIMEKADQAAGEDLDV
jgi:DNA gyrase/topoisomerase IV subunit B